MNDQHLDLSTLPVDGVWVFLTCFNRLAMTQESLQSLVQQTEKNLTIIVSDNSTNDEIENWIRSNQFQRPVFYIHWRPTLQPPYDHASRIFSLVSQWKPECWQMFHDDDIAYPGMVERLLRVLQKNIDWIAVVPNAVEFNESGPTGLMRFDGNDRIIRTSRELLAQYFTPSCGVAPWPGTLFRSRASEVGKNGFRGGKYMDVWTNSNLLKLGKLKWLGEPLMLYRRHSQQDSHGHSVKDKFSLYNALVRQGLADKSGSTYAWFFLQNWKHFRLRAQGQRKISGRVQRLARLQMLKIFLSPILWYRLVRKTFWKFIRAKINSLSYAQMTEAKSVLKSVQTEISRRR